MISRFSQKITIVFIKKYFTVSKCSLFLTKKTYNSRKQHEKKFTFYTQLLVFVKKVGFANRITIFKIIRCPDCIREKTQCFKLFC